MLLRLCNFALVLDYIDLLTSLTCTCVRTESIVLGRNSTNPNSIYPKLLTTVAEMQANGGVATHPRMWRLFPQMKLDPELVDLLNRSNGQRSLYA